jgi:dipeptidyl aminopeptidase/acylaminoacyl peptidase
MTAPTNDDHLLDRAIAAVLAQPAPRDARDRALAAAARLAFRPPPRRPSPLVSAAAVVLLIGLIAALVARALKDTTTPTRTAQPPAAPLTAAPPQNPRSSVRLTEPAVAGDVPFTGRRRLTDAYKAPAIPLIAADDASVIVASGGPDPLPLGHAALDRNAAAAAGKLHVWDFSRSAASRIVPGVELWNNHNLALTPDGTKLLFADGDLVDLATGKSTRVDLGGATYKVGESTYTRIGHMRFSPDGKRLVFILTLRNHDANDTVRWVYQIVDFPSAKPLAQFPAEDTYNLRLAFTPDGNRILSPDPDRRLALRDVATGDVIRHYEPPVTSHVMSLAISPDGTRLTAGSHDGELACWDAATGQRLWAVKLAPTTPQLLRFSRDGRTLALADFGDIRLLDPTTGQTTRILPQRTTGHLRWSADSKTLTAVTAPYANDDGRQMYPDAHTWDVETATELPRPK